VLSLLLHAAAPVTSQQNSTSTDSSISTIRGRSNSADVSTDDDSYVMTTETFTATRKTFVRGPPPGDIAAAAAAQLAATAAAQVGRGASPQGVGVPMFGQHPGQALNQQQQQQQSSGWVPASAPQQGPMAGPNPASSGGGSSSSSNGMSNGGSSSSSKPISPAGAADSQPSMPSQKPAAAEAAVATTLPLIPAFGTPTATASVTTGPQTGGAAGNSSKTWRPSYPFPQCLDNTLTYDVSFVGQRQFIQVGEWQLAAMQLWLDW
jgi:hypothetical protein